MMDHIKSLALGAGRLEDRVENNSELWPSFKEWMLVNGSKAKILARQHQVEALKMFLKNKGNKAVRKEQSWWIYDIYNKGRLSFYLHILTFMVLANTLFRQATTLA
jgi:hypothetical protein